MCRQFLVLVFLPFLLLLSQAGSTSVVYQSSNQVSSTVASKSIYRGGILDPDYDYGYGYGTPPSEETKCDQPKALPCNETRALKTVLQNLGMTLITDIPGSLCSKKDSFYSVGINCTLVGSFSRITKISAESMYLKGFISADVAAFTYLEILDLSDNQLHGSIPTKISSLYNLVTLDLSGNKLTGPIPKKFQLLKNLRILRLNVNRLNGTIPPSLGNLSSLVTLDLWGNKLSDRIPPDLGNLTQLQILRLDDNQLTGELPPNVDKWSNLQQLWVTSNNLNGKIPDSYAGLTNLTAFGVGGNRLVGKIPEYIATQWTNLTILDLLGNEFDGSLPLEILNMTKLRVLWVSDLKQGFKFPPSANLSSVYSLILRNCKIDGDIPPNIGNRSWSKLDLSFNELTGPIPDTFEKKTIYDLFLTGNKLTGEIKPWLNYTVYDKADLSFNDFKLPVPDNKHKDNSHDASLTPLKINLEPQNKNFIKEEMKAHCPHRKNKYHSLYINSGGRNVKIGGRNYEADNSTSLFYRSGSNWAYSCSGDLQSSADNSSDYIKKMKCAISDVEAPDVEDPLYTDARFCPQALTYYGYCLQNGNYTVRLHFAEIVYGDDEDLSSNGKRIFDISVQGTVLKDYEILKEAKVPNNRTFEDFPAYVDQHVLEISLNWRGKGSIYRRPSVNGPLISAITVTPDFKVGGLSFAEIVVISVAAIFIPLLLLMSLWTMGLVGDKALREARVELRGTSYTVKEVVDATRNFSSKTEIGRGQYGIVYKAVLPDQTVGVKKLTPHSKQVVDQIGREVYTLKKVRHPNLVEFLDGYSRKGLHLLIYEHMEHRSLAFTLFNPESTVVLDWDTRYNICLGIAKALEYLHEDSRRIIHRNIKPSNILLDGNLNAKVSDFGLAKLYEEENLNVVIGAGDTLVYMAPEYATVKVVTEKTDVYSYGIVLLEIISGKRSADYKPDRETVYLLDTAHLHQSKGNLLRLVDEKLRTYNRDQALNILNIAIMCIDQSPTLRPTMSEIVSVLEDKKNINQIAKVTTA